MNILTFIKFYILIESNSDERKIQFHVIFILEDKQIFYKVL